MRTKFSLMLSLFCLPLAFWACGDDSSSSASDDYSAVSDLESSRSTSKDVIASSSAAKQSTSSSSSEDVAASSSSAKSSSSSEKAESSSSDSYLCHIYDLSDALSCECDKSREGKLSYNYDSDVELVCYHDEYLDKWGWVKVTNPDQESSSSAGSCSSSSVNQSGDEFSSSSVASSSSVESSSSIEYSSSENSSSSVILSSSSSVIPSDVEESVTDVRDGQTYKTVKIGSQIWMAENLNFEYDEGSAKSFCYNNKADSCAKYGRLYLWSAAMDSAAVFSDDAKGCGFGAACAPKESYRGLCPEGWHLPSITEWETLFATVGGIDDAGKMLRSASGWIEDCSDGEDAYGFSALPAGYRFNFGSFNDAGSMAYFWAGSESSDEKAYIVYLNGYYAYAKQKSDYKNVASSVRCIKD